jgi:MOSC domain-containing protein YiiM
MKVGAITGKVSAVARDNAHRFAKPTCDVIRLIAGLGVEGDAHCGQTVQHRSRVARTPAAPNLRQVHLIHAELFAELAAKGFSVAPGALGENVTTTGIDLLGLSQGTRLQLGQNALVEVTGLRNPCRQIDENVGRGAMAATLDRASDGSLLRKAGVMAVVLESGEVRAGDAVSVVWTPPEPLPLGPV